MSVIKCDMTELVKLANRIDEFDKTVSLAYERLFNAFNELYTNQLWTDEKYMAFKENQMSPLEETINRLFVKLDDPIREFLKDYYKELQDYNNR